MINVTKEITYPEARTLVGASSFPQPHCAFYAVVRATALPLLGITVTMKSVATQTIQNNFSQQCPP